MTTRLLYPENPTVPGALSRDELMRVGRKYFQKKSQATDYDILSAAVRATKTSKLVNLDDAENEYSEMVRHREAKKARRLFLKSGVSTETVSDNGESPLAYTDNAQAKEFFAEQRRKQLGQRVHGTPNGKNRKMAI